MKKIFFSITLITLFFLSSCNSFFRIEKRKYMKGYYVDFSGGKNIKNHSEKSLDKIIVKYAEENNYATTDFTEKKISIKDPNYNNRYSQTYLTSEESNVIKAENIITPANKTINKKTKITERRKKQNHDITIPIGLAGVIAGFMGLSFAGIYRYKKSSLLNIQSWAFKNKFKARAILVLYRALLMIIGFGAGVKLLEENYLFPEYAMPLFSGTLIIGTLTYPFRKTSLERTFSFLRTKTSELIVGVSGLLLCITLGNQVAYENSKGINRENHLNKRSAVYFESPKNISVNNPGSILESKDEDDYGMKALKTTLLILTIISITLLEVLAIVLSCMLVCEGVTAMAILVGFGGTGILVALSIFTIYWIKRIKTKEKDPAYY